MNTVRI